MLSTMMNFYYICYKHCYKEIKKNKDFYYLTILILLMQKERLFQMFFVIFFVLFLYLFLDNFISDIIKVIQISFIKNK